MAVLHHATIVPGKSELIEQWIPTRPWGPSGDSPVAVVGSFRFDDPDGRVGLETLLVTAGDTLLQVPLTYRDEPLAGAEDALITQAEHSVLGMRWIYDGLGDDLYITMLAAVALTGQGQALSLFRSDGHWVVAPGAIRLHAGGWTQELVPVDGFELVSGLGPSPVFHSDRFALTVLRRPEVGPRPAIGVSAGWEGLDGEVVLAEIRER